MATQSTTSISTNGVSNDGATVNRLTSGLGALLMGSALLFLVGFAPMPAVHNAAHDTRHSAAFPCH